MTTMADYVAQMYQTTPPAESQQKLANAELFAKLATKSGVDLTQFTPEQAADLYDRLMKTASAEPAPAAAPPAPPQADLEAEKRAAAEVHLKERREFAEKIASADVMGRVMARAMFDEVQKIAGSMPPQFMQAAKGGDKKEEAPPAKTEEEEKKAAAAACESLAVEHAVKVASDANYNPELIRDLCEPARKHGLLPVESEKVAHAMQLGGDPTQNAVAARGFEYLEHIGVPVDWKQVFGG